MVRRLFLLALLAAAATPAAAGDLATRLPADTVAYLDVPDPAAALACLRRGRWTTLARDPFVRAVLAGARDRLRAGRGHDEATGRVWPGRFLDAGRGPLGLALVPAGGAERPVLLVGGAPPGTARRIEEALAASGLRARRVASSYRGVAVSTWAPAGGEGTPPPTCYFQQGDLLAVAWGPEALRRLVDVVAERTPPLAGLAPYRTVRSRLGPAHAALYLSRRAIEALSDWRERGTDALARAGLDGIAALGAGVRLLDDGLGVRLFLHAPGAKRGLLKFFDADNEALAPPAFLPAGTRAACTVRLDVPGLVDELRRVVRQVAPDRADGLPDDLEAAVRSTGGEAAIEFLRSIGDEFSTLTLGPGDAAALVVEVGSPRRMRRLLHAMEGGVTARRGARFVAPDGSAVALAGDHLLAARRERDVAALLAAHAAGAPGLTATAAWQRVESELPARRILLWYARHERTPDRPDLWSAWLRAQGTALVNDPDGVLLAHFALLRGDAE